MYLLKPAPEPLLLKGKREHTPRPNGASNIVDMMGTGWTEQKWQHRYHRALEILRRYDFDAVAFSGYSGCLIASLLARDLGKSLLLVRKPRIEEGDTHSCYTVEGDYEAQSYVIVDDLAASGATVRRIHSSIVSDVGPHVICLGVLQFLYPNDDNTLDKLEDFVSEKVLEDLKQYEGQRRPLHANESS